MPSPIDPHSAQVIAALAKLEADPNLATERTINTLKWAGKAAKDKTDSSGLQWLIDLFTWLAQSGRYVFWIAIALLAALIVIYAYRLIRAHQFGRRTRFDDAPTHIRDLDIRPESLPEHIGGAALGMWNSGEHRAALALLYRGLLSRLVHIHSIPIQDSSTEGDCLALCARHLQSRRKDYAAQLIGIWQKAVYGGQDPSPEVMVMLCDGFSTAMDPELTAQPLAQPA